MAAAPIAFVCAMPMELRPLTKRLGLESTTIGGGRAKKGTLDGREVVAIVTGMGTELATAGIKRLLDAVTPERVVVVGITGAVENETPIGTLMLPERIIDAETGREHVHHVLGPGTPHGAMWTTNVITPFEELAGLREQGVVSLDMETAAIALECETRGVPWCVFRTISDRASDGTVDDELFRLSNQDGTPNPRAVVRYILRHPGRLPQMARMGRNAKLATERAADAAIAAVRTSLRS
jgi:adenosylhomocysteine nucleosidase